MRMTTSGLALGLFSALLLFAGHGPTTAADALGLTPSGPHDATIEVAEPDSYKTDDYRSPVPKTLKGARVIHVEEAEALYKDKSTVFIDVYPQAPRPPNLPANTVWRDPTHMTIEGAHWLPNVGYGTLSPEFEAYLKTNLETLTGGDKGRALVFFCLKNCWMSWNAAKRALTYGYTNVIWFPEGTDAWQEAGNDLVKATKR